MKIEISLNPRPPLRRWRYWRAARPKVIAVFAFRYDAHLVPGLLQNISPFVDGWVSYDDRERQNAISTDPQRRHPLIEAAHAAGAEWILAADPDERFEDRLKEKIDRLTAVRDRIAWSFRFRELYSPGEYRVDGEWAKKRQKKLFAVFDDLFPIAARRSFPEKPFHGEWTPKGYERRLADVNVYHLKMIARARREARRDLYTALDPDRKMQAIGYDYLADETGAEFERIAPERAYSPPHVEDGGLWMPDPAKIAKP